MDIQVMMDKYLSRIPRGIATRVFSAVKNIPFIKKAIENELNTMMAELEGSLKPYKNQVQSFAKLPQTGVGRDDIVKIMEGIHEQEVSTWEDGYVSGAVYHGDPEHIEFLNRIYGFNS